MTMPESLLAMLTRMMLYHRGADSSGAYNVDQACQTILDRGFVTARSFSDDMFA